MNAYVNVYAFASNPKNFAAWGQSFCLGPRGVSDGKAAIDLCLKDLAPGPEPGKWFGHDSNNWDEFRKRYWSELGEKGDLLTLLKHRTTEGNVTFVFAARDAGRNSAVAPKGYLEVQM